MFRLSVVFLGGVAWCKVLLYVWCWKKHGWENNVKRKLCLKVVFKETTKDCCCAKNEILIQSRNGEMVCKLLGECCVIAIRNSRPVNLFRPSKCFLMKMKLTRDILLVLLRQTILDLTKKWRSCPEFVVTKRNLPCDYSTGLQ